MNFICAASCSCNVRLLVSDLTWLLAVRRVKVIFFAMKEWKQPTILCIKVKVNQTPPHEDVWGGGGIALRILNLDTRWRWMVNFASRPFYTSGKSWWFPLDERPGQTLVRKPWRKENSLPLLKYNPRSPITRLTELFGQCVIKNKCIYANVCFQL